MWWWWLWQPILDKELHTVFHTKTTQVLATSYYPLLKVMYELAGTIAKSTTHNQGQGGITRSRMSQPCYDRYDPYDEEN